MWVCVQVKANITKDLGSEEAAEEGGAECKGPHAAENGRNVGGAGNTHRGVTVGAPAGGRPPGIPRATLAGAE